MNFNFYFLLLSAFVLGSYSSAKSDRSPSSTSRPFYCHGTEPFYSLEISGGRAVLKEDVSGPDSRSFDVTGPTDASGLTSGNAFAFRSTDGKAVISILSSRFAGAKCTDGMSDSEYRYHMMFVSENSVLAGCCSRTKRKP